MIFAFFSSVFRTVVLVARWFLVGGIVGLRPLVGSARCRFTVTCTEFALLQLESEPLGAALMNILKRLSRCHPFWWPRA